MVKIMLFATWVGVIPLGLIIILRKKSWMQYWNWRSILTGLLILSIEVSGMIVFSKR